MMRVIPLQTATEVEMREFYKNWNDVKKEFESMRPSFYFTHGSFNFDPLLSHYKSFLINKGVKSIIIKEAC